MEPAETDIDLVESLEEEIDGLESEFEEIAGTSRERHRRAEELIREINSQIRFLRDLAEKND